METDASLIKKWTDQRDAEAFEEVMRRYAGLVYGTAKRILGSDTEAEDVAQECFLRLSAADVAVTEHLGGWLHRVATNHAISKLRSDARRKRREDHYAKNKSATDPVTWDDLQELVDEAINRLEPESRDLVVAYFLQKRTQDSLAEEFGVSRQAVSHRISKGVEEIRRQLERKGVIVGAAAFETILLSRPADAVPAAFGASLAKLAIAGGRVGAKGAAAGGGLLSSTAVWAAAVLVVIVLGGFFAYRGGVFQAGGGGDSQPDATTDAGLQIVTTQSAPNEIAVTPQAPLENLGFGAPATAPSQTNPAAAIANGRVFGRVVDAATQRPLASITLSFALVSGESAHAVTSDGNGTFQLDALALGAYAIGLDDPAYAIASAEPGFELSTNTPTQELLITLVPQGQVRGRVYDQDTNEGIPDVLVTASQDVAKARLRTEDGLPLSVRIRAQDAGGGQPEAYTAITDEHGVFVFQGLGEGTYEISRQDVPGYEQIVRLVSDDVRVVTVSKDSVRGNAEFRLSRGGGIAGRVTLAGQPIANATFELVCYVRPGREDDQIVKTIRGVRTDVNGNYIVETLPVFEEPGLFMLRQTSPARDDFTSLKEAAYIKSGGTTPVDFQFTERTAKLEGYVRTSTGEPLRAKFVGGDTVYGVVQTRFRGETDDDGHFLIENLPSAQIHVNFIIEDVPGYRALNAILEEGQHASQDLIVHNTLMRCEALNVPSNSAFLMFEVYPATYDVPPGTDIVSLNERSDVQLLRIPFAEGTGMIQGIAPGTYTVVAYSSTLPLESSAEEGVDYNKFLKDSHEVLQQVTITDGSDINLTFDFSAQ